MSLGAGAFNAVRWINRRGAPLFVLLLLICAGIAAHRVLLAQVKGFGMASAGVEGAVAARIQFMNYVDQHPWIVLPYLLVCVAAVIWLQVRAAPRWALWISFAFLTLPIFGYMWICLGAATPRLTSM